LTTLTVRDRDTTKYYKMADYTVDDVAQITVDLKDGRRLVYKNKGIAKLVRTLTAQKKTVIVTEDDSESSDDPDDVGRRSRRKEKQLRPSTANGYILTSLNYESNNQGRSPQDIARDLQKQAELANPNVRY
jgi:hypothetical protein